MTSPLRHRHALAPFLLALGLAAASASAQAPDKGAPGLCPADTRRLDAYMQALCEGEQAMQAGDLKAAQERFRFAAALPRAEATNELAWAGLAAAHCGSREIDAGKQWAAHFAEARGLWMGDLDCGAGGDDPRARLSPFVRSRMCSDALAADYALVRTNPKAAHALDLQARLQQIGDALAVACAASPVAQPQPAGSARAVDADGKKVKTGKRGGRAGTKPKTG